MRGAGGAARQRGDSDRIEADSRRYPTLLFPQAGREDFAGIIKKAAELGFSGVEFAGYGPYGDKPDELRKMLDDAGIKAFGTHTAYNLVQPDKIQKTIDFHKAIGCPYIIVPWIDPKQMEAKDNCLKIAEIMTRASETAQAAGLSVGYHAHGGDFKKIDRRPDGVGSAFRPHPQGVCASDRSGQLPWRREIPTS